MSFITNKLDLRPIELKFSIYYFISRFFIFANIWILFLLVRGLTLVDVALIDIAFWVAVLVFEIPTGVVADKFGRKLSLSFAYLIQTIAIIIFAFSYSFLQFIISYIIWGLGITFLSGAEEAWFYDEIFHFEKDIEKTQKRFQKLYGINKSIGLLSTALAGVLGGILASISFELPILLTAVMFFIVFLFLSTIPEHNEQTPKDEESNGQVFLATKTLLKSFALVLSLIVILVSTVQLTVVFWMQPFLDLNNLNYSMIGLVLSIGIIFGGIGYAISGRATELTNQYTVVFAIIILSASYILMGVSTPFFIIVFFLQSQLIRGILMPYLKSRLNSQLTSKTRATALSLVGGINTLFILGLEYGSAIYIQNRSFEAYFLTIGFVFFVLGIPLAFLILAKGGDDKKEIPVSPVKLDSGKTDLPP